MRRIKIIHFTEKLDYYHFLKTKSKKIFFKKIPHFNK